MRDKTWNQQNLESILDNATDLSLRVPTVPIQQMRWLDANKDRTDCLDL
jgi:hypothetical protein